MSYLQQLAASAAPMGSPPPTPAPNVGTPPPQAHIEPAPYDAAKDPTWKTLLRHGGEEFRNFLNGLEDGPRQMLHSVITSIQNNPFTQAANALAPPTPAPISPPQLPPGASMPPPQ